MVNSADAIESNGNIRTHYRKIITIMLIFWSSHFMYKHSVIFTSLST